MKLVTKILPVICILITTILSLIFLEFRQSNSYLNFKGYQKDFISIEYNNDVEINYELLDQMIDLARGNHVILAKRNLSTENNEINNIYFSFETATELADFLKKSFKIQDMSIGNTSEKTPFISTYTHKDSGQLGLIPDLFENTYYNYYMFDALKENRENLYGSYIVYYQNRENYETFKNEIQTLIGIGTANIFSTSGIQNSILILIGICIFLLMLFYFIFQVYDTYYQSKKIGCMKLLGFENCQISKNLIQKKFFIYVLFVFVLLVFVRLFVKNITLLGMLFLVVINSFLLLLTYWVHDLCIKFILGKHQVSNILKKENLAFQISKISGRLKVVMIILLITTITFLFYSFNMVSESLKNYKKAKELFNYGIIYGVSNGKSKEQYEYEKHADLYQSIINDPRLETFYVKFDAYGNMTEEEINRIDTAIENGTSFLQVTVDRNYLKKEKVIVYDIDNYKVDVDQIDGLFFLFPRSKMKKIEQFQNRYEDHAKKVYEENGIQADFQAYIYDDQLLNSYDVEVENSYVRSPIVRVINEDFRMSYMNSSAGLDLFGSGLHTGLKIKIVEDTLRTADILFEHIQESELDNYINKSGFISYRDYFQEDIQTARLVVFSTVIAITIVLAIYVMISVQVISLYVRSEEQKIMVKYLLGYKKDDIFAPILERNRFYNVIAFILTVLLLAVLGKINLLLLLTAMIAFLVIDFVIVFCIVHFYDFSKIYIGLKGGNYD